MEINNFNRDSVNSGTNGNMDSGINSDIGDSSVSTSAENSVSSTPSTSSSYKRTAVKRDVFSESKSKRKKKEKPNAPNVEDGPIKVGTKISYWENRKIGNGGTASVYRGFYENRKVPAAVKIMLKEFVTYYKNEVEVLQSLLIRTKSSYIVRYYSSEEDKNRTQFYLAMELGETTLDKHIIQLKRTTPNDKTDEQLVSFVHNTCDGLELMHCGKRNNPIVHRDIKPSNILLMRSSDDGESFIAKLTDFGLSKILTNAISQSTKAEGTDDWASPSYLDALDKHERENDQDVQEFRTKINIQDDIFSLGMVIFYVMTLGIHPYGPRMNRVSNICKGNPDYKPMISLRGLKGFVYLNLIHSMLELDPALRPDITTVLKHPMFWTEEYCLGFLNAVSNYLLGSKSSHDAVKNCLSKMQNSLYLICSCETGWTSHLCTKVQKFLEDQRKAKPSSKKYDGKSVLKLIEFVRDKYQHKSEWIGTLDTNDVFGNEGSTYIHYFTTRFPLLIPIIFIELQQLANVIPHDLKQFFPDYSFKLTPKDLKLKVDCNLKKVDVVPGQNGNIAKPKPLVQLMGTTEMVTIEEFSMQNMNI